MRTCTHCGVEIGDSASFCPHCGEASSVSQSLSAAASPSPIDSTFTGPPTQVAIVDIHVPFWSMVILMVKLSIAAIPTAIIITVLYVAIFFYMAALAPR